MNNKDQKFSNNQKMIPKTEEDNWVIISMLVKTFWLYKEINKNYFVMYIYNM